MAILLCYDSLVFTEYNLAPMPASSIAEPEKGSNIPVPDSAMTKENMTNVELQPGDDELGSTMEVIDPKAESRMLRKFDVSAAGLPACFGFRLEMSGKRE